MKFLPGDNMCTVGRLLWSVATTIVLGGLDLILDLFACLGSLLTQTRGSRGEHKSTFAEDRTRAAKWIYERKDRVYWWRFVVLTEYNSKDPDTLKLDVKTAGRIFSDFIHDGLLVPAIASDGEDIAAYTINPGKDDLWRKAMHPWEYWIWRNTKWLFVTVISSVISGFIGIGIGVLLRHSVQ